MKLREFIIVAFLGVVGVSIGIIFWYSQSPQSSPVASQAEIVFQIHPDESLLSITNRLEEEGFIRSAALFRLYSRITRTDGSIRHGSFMLSKDKNLYHLHEDLLHAIPVMKKVTIPEGFTSRRIATLLEENGITIADEFLALVKDSDVLTGYGLSLRNSEGFLFPDTYFFVANHSPKKVLEHMVEAFFRALESQDIDSAFYSQQELYQRVILASIIEREYRSPEEAPLIASVFYNRLSIDMPLQSCATIIYVMTEEQGLEHPSRLYYSDLERSSFFNTYQHSGLPPSPISNPGIVALGASFFPAQTDYWFFVLRGYDETQHHFTSNLNEHIDAKLLYLKSSYES